MDMGSFSWGFLVGGTYASLMALVAMYWLQREHTKRMQRVSDAGIKALAELGERSRAEIRRVAEEIPTGR